MGVELRRPAPNWGRSYHADLPVQASVQQLVRVSLAKPEDLTLYLGGQAIGQTSVTWLTYRLSVGNGGISLVNEKTIAPARGIARHFVADQIEADAEVRAASGTGQALVVGCVAIGRPVEIIEPGVQITTLGPLDSIPGPYFSAVQNTGWTSVGPVALGQRRVFRAPLWSSQMRIEVANATGAAATQIVEEYSAGGALLQTRTAADYLVMSDLDPQTWFVVLSASPANSWDALVTFKRTT